MTEEDITGRLLLPYLNDLGFDLSEIELERAFKIRLGKSVHKTGRSDILCKKHGKNLFIIEVKNESLSISENDIKQGISYATSLEDGIAPFTIVTNGGTTKVFDSISREELSGSKISQQSPFWKNGCTLSIEEDLKIRYEALKNFISLSPENLKIFCGTQVSNRMGAIVGNVDDPFAKFVKELHISRQSLQIAFKEFIEGEASVFGLVGPAGVGKTGAMCSLALQSLEDRFVFFYNAALINKSPLEHLAQDLNIAFSTKNDGDIVLKKLNELGHFANRDILIFIDAIDECINPNISIELSEIALIVKYLDRVKICLSCKSNIWSRILKSNDNRTHLYEELCKVHNTIAGLDDCPAFLLNDFNDDEIEDIIPLYQTFFGFKGVISKILLKELRNGFFLRIFSEVYSNKKVPEKINDKDLINKYIKLSLEKTTIDVSTGRRILAKIGKVLSNQIYDSWVAFEDKGLDVVELLEELNFAIDKIIPEELFSRNLLIKSNNEDSYNVNFYYSKIRDYIVCYHSYNLEKLGDDEFYNVLNDLFKNHIGRSAIEFYINNATATHQRILKNFKRDKALSYVTAYDTYLNNNFNNLKEKFDPGTVKDIGIILPDDLINGDGYALFPMDSHSSNRIQYANLDTAFSGSFNEDSLIQKGVQSVYGSYMDLMVPDHTEVVKKNVFKQLKKFIEKGKLDAYNSEILLLEKVALIVYYYQKELDYGCAVKDFRLPRFEAIYPIDLKDLKYRIYKFRAIQHYSRQNIDRDQMAQLVIEALRNPGEIPEFNNVGDTAPFKELFKIVDVLLEMGHYKITNHYLPFPDKSIDEVKALYEQDGQKHFQQIRSLQFSEQQAKRYIKLFFESLETSYRDFIEYCFPTFKNQFSFFKNAPHEYFFYPANSDVFKWVMFGYRNSQSGELKVHFKNAPTSHQDPFEKDGINVLRGFSLEMILYNRNSIPTVNRINTSKIDDFCVIRNWVYQMLRLDIQDIFKNMNT